ncbi:type II toxin-antitoxin system VapC family toxin [Aestuariivirga sp.]|uniref:type II toxin-antitoxin system VapC family toxin n=1 Tax=Aestuariivirga sp. TaxID=2650926 RepID=UPI0039E330F0
MTIRYMLDTNIVSDLVRNPQGKVFDGIGRTGAEAVCVSIITATELRYGCAKRGSEKLRRQIDAILEGLEILALDVPADTEYASIRAELERAGKPIGPNDLLIAAHARAMGAVLVTANINEFSRIPKLRLENWLE